jgi:hypothetical protein
MFRTNTNTFTNDKYFEGSDEGSDFLYNKDDTNETIDSINKNKNKLQYNDLRSKLLSHDNMIIITETKKHILYLICIISISIIIGIILFAIYNLTNGKKSLFNYSKICFVVALCLTCCLCSCMKYKYEIEKINIPLISV